MTIAELITALQAFNSPNREVRLCSDDLTIKKIEFVLNDQSFQGASIILSSTNLVSVAPVDAYDYIPAKR